MAKYKQEPKERFDQLTLNFLEAMANDYRKEAKLLEFRQNQGQQIVQEKLNKMQKKLSEQKKKGGVTEMQNSEMQ